MEKTLIDHKDGNGLNNQKSNLRLCNKSQNGANKKKYKENATSIYKGIYLVYDKCWYARIKVKRKYICIGNFISEIDAAIAYDIKAKEHFGEFANLNFPDKIISEQEKNRIFSSLKKIKKKGSTSKYNGVYFNGKLYSTRFKNKIIRSFRDEKDAAIYYDYLSLKENLNHTNLNFPDATLSDYNRIIQIINNPTNNELNCRGVSKKKDKYYVRIYCNKKIFCLGTFLFLKDAMIAYNNKAIELFGDKAKLNIIPE